MREPGMMVNVPIRMRIPILRITKSCKITLVKGVRWTGGTVAACDEQGEESPGFTGHGDG